MARLPRKLDFAGWSEIPRWCAWLIGGEITPAWVAYAMARWRRTDLGRPVASIRFRTAKPMATSAFWEAKPRARIRGPIRAL
jgi:hypothetical protein